MPHPVDPSHFEALAGMDPADVCRRAICRYDEEEPSYRLRAWGEEFIISPRQKRIERIAGGAWIPHPYFYIFLVHYLLGAQEIAFCDQWISEKDLPNGPTFFRGPHEIPTRQITSRYGADAEGFAERCAALGGTPMEMADQAFVFDIAPRIPAAVLLWEADPEFAAEAKLLFDKSISSHLAMDTVFALAVEICHRIGGPEREE